MASRRMLSDYLDPSPHAALAQWRSILERRPPEAAGRQEAFTPVETLLCLAAMYLVPWRRFGSGSDTRAPSPIPALAALFRRSVPSIRYKMGNLDGTFAHGGRLDLQVGTELLDDAHRLTEIYRIVVAAARAAGVGPAELPDFLGLEHGGVLHLLGQDELADAGAVTTIEREIEDALRRHRDVPERETERLVLGSVRVGQHTFAKGVLANCGDSCVFCGFVMSAAPPSGLLHASHVKPWRDSSPVERLDVANGLAACPTHDAAFDAGLLTVADDLSVVQSDGLIAARRQNPAVEKFFGTPPLREHIALPEGAMTIDISYLDWHRGRIFVT